MSVPRPTHRVVVSSSAEKEADRGTRARASCLSYAQTPPTFSSLLLLAVQRISALVIVVCCRPLNSVCCLCALLPCVLLRPSPPSYVALTPRKVMRREREGTVAVGKDYAQRPASYKGSLALKV